MSDSESNELLNRYLTGDEKAAVDIFDRYVERLLAFARARMSKKLKRRIDEEDIVQSAYRSFFVHARNREYFLRRAGDLWRLLVGVTRNKLHGQIEKNTAAKRSFKREAIADFETERFATHEPTAADVVAAAERLKLVMKGLTSDQRQVLQATLQGESIEAIAASIGKSTRTVRRLFAEAKRQFERLLLDSSDGAKSEPPTVPTLAAEPNASFQFANFILKRLIGSGGMGKVYEATEKQTGVTVAIKTLHKSRQKDKRAVSHFVQESQILTRIRHPNIVSVRGLGQFPGGRYFLVMEFVDGADLQSKLASGVLPINEAMTIVTDVATGIRHTHNHGVIHCDLKPANILVSADNRIHVTDFGFAFVLGRSAQTKAPSIGGTTGYIALEILGAVSEPRPAADVFALGVILWQLVTGQIPASIASVQTDVVELKSIAIVCRRCMAADPKKRFATTTDLIDALKAIRNPTAKRGN